MQRPAALPAVCLLALAASACGGSSTGASNAASTATITATPAAATATPTATVAATAAATATATAAPKAASTGVTKAGSTLKLGESARVKSEYKLAKTATGVLEVTAVSVKRGSISDLKNFKLDAQTKTSTPFYVTVRFHSLGKKSFVDTGFMGNLSVLNHAGDKAGTITLLGDFPKCQGTVPDTLKPNAAFTTCDVYILPKGQRVTKLNYSDGTDDGVNWPAS